MTLPNNNDNALGALLTVTLLLWLAPLAGAAEPERIENSRLAVECGPGGDTFQLARADGTKFAELRFDGEAGKVGVTPWRHPQLGSGRAIEVSLASGAKGRIILADALPFVLVDTLMVNGTSEEKFIHDIKPFDLTLSLPEPANELVALGTAGLTAPDEHAGSYAFLAVAAPKTRGGVVSGWLSHDRGCGVVLSDVVDGSVRLAPQIDYGRLRLAPDSETASELFAVGPFDDARLGLEAYADAIALFYQIRLRPIVAGYCTWYAAKHGGACDEVHLDELSKLAAEKLGPYGFDFVQIDDKWQEGERRNGPAKNFYAHAPDGPYPSGMKQAADRIRSLGLMAGIWFMPFAGDHEDPFFQQHLDWFVKREDGTPYWAKWGGTSLDMTNPEARAYVRSIVRRIGGEWGYNYFKMDGLWTGSATELLYVNNEYKEDDIGQAVFHNPDKTNVEAYRDGLKLVREAAGPDTFFLGCNVSQNMRSFGASFGLLDAMRVGPDNGAARKWKGLVKGPWHGTNRYFLHGRVWYNDPDPLGIHASMPLEHAQLICSWVAITGQLNVFSEWLPEVPQERIDVLRRTIPNHGLLPRPVDLFQSDLARVWLLTDDRGPTRRDVVGLFNWSEDEPDTLDYSLAEIGLPEGEQMVGFDYWADEFVPPFSGRLQCTLPGGTCRVLALRVVSDHPQLVSTSRHVSQGIIDVTDERWNAESLTLSGRSELVGGDPYELRIVAPAGGKSFKVAGAGVSAADSREGVKTSWEQEGPQIRVRIESPGGRGVDWSVRFDRSL